MPRALPLGHTGSSVSLSKILENGALEPRYCRVMRRRTLYLYYGGLAYRSGTSPTQEETALPIGFLFHPRILLATDVHYPFDTGAMAAGLYGTAGLPAYKSEFRVTATGMKTSREPSRIPRLIVKHLFADNTQYLAGRPSSAAVTKPSPLPELFRFMTAPNDRSDHRRACVETQREAPLRLGDNLLWLGYPDVFEAEVQQFLREHDPDVPLDTWAYSTFARFKASEVCAMLQGRASEILERFLAT